MRGTVSAIWICALVASGCYQTIDVEAYLDGGFDGGTDAGADAGTDGGMDAGTDAGTDGGTDAGTDAGMDGGTDAGTDAGMDGGIDGGTDAGLDGGTDAGMDGGTDAGIDAGTDAGMDGGTDAGIDAGTDGGVVTSCADLCASFLGWTDDELRCVGGVLRIAGYAPGATPECRVIRNEAECEACAEGMGLTDNVCAALAFLCFP